MTSIVEAIDKVCPGGHKYAPHLEEACKKYGIDTPLRQAHFLAQITHESGFLKIVTENLNYSAEGLKKIFRKYFPGTLANEYARQPIKIGNRVYANRMGNGNEASGDGYKYRGGGLMQTTGHDNILEYSMAMYGDDRVVQNPDLLRLPRDAAYSAAFYWFKNRLNEWADKDNVVAVSGLINTGSPHTAATAINGMSDRSKWLNLYKGVLL